MMKYSVTDRKEKNLAWYFIICCTRYLLEINKSINDTYACTLSCKCRIRFKLPLMATGFCKLSTYCRHLTEKQCLTSSMTIREKDNISINNGNSTSRSNSYSKRTRSSSRHTTSNTKENVRKKE
ncbi:unnamed protein product [Rotaria socialis]|uniref:Uncharacterized protein n=1 Tax=Rotaria socialis TaxID=392032 RepID=A0A817QPE3_9BILA|nr:unnamed protein product [Rotaria socialis]CAF3600905.1 unnamed protein product [Rotaria socialis]